MDAKLCGLISHVQYWSQVNYVLCGIAEYTFQRMPQSRMGNSFSGSIEGSAWPSTQYHAFRFGYRCENTMLIQTAKYRIASPYQQGVLERLLNNAAGPVAK